MRLDQPDHCRQRSAGRYARLRRGPPFRGSALQLHLGGRSSRDWVTLPTAALDSGEWQDGKRLHLLRWRDPQTSLACCMELTEFRDFPGMEWVIRLRNDGPAETEPVAGFKALDITWQCAQAGETPELRRAFGSDGRFDDFQPQRDELRQSMWYAPRTIRMDKAANTAFRKARNGSATGMAADSRTFATWLPFFNLQTGGDGILCALGWSGQWFAQFAHDGAGKTEISAGMEHLELKLRLGEEIRSPRVLLKFLLWIEPMRAKYGTPVTLEHPEWFLQRYLPASGVGAAGHVPL